MSILSELRHAVARLSKAPTYTAAAVAMLAVALAANTAVLGVVHAVLLRPLPMSAPRGLLVVWEADVTRDLPVVELPYRLVDHWRRNSRSFVSVAAMGSSLWPAELHGHGDPTRVSTSGVTANFFSTLGATPVTGRTFDADDDAAGAADVAILTHGAWVRLFAGRTDVLGTSLNLDRRRTIVGVMARDFDYPRGTDFWVPVVPILAGIAAPGFNPFEDIGMLYGIGRLRDGVSRDAAVAELNNLSAVPIRDGAPFRFGSSVVAQSFLDHYLGPVRPALLAVWAGVGMLLLISCANVSGLMLTRVIARRRHHAIRLALGATSADLRRIWVLESLVVTIAGAAIGWLLAGVLLRAIIAVAPGDVPRLDDAALSPAVAAFTCLAVLMTALLTAAGPARGATSARAREALSDGGRTTSASTPLRMRSALVVGQIALSVVLLVAAGLVVRSYAVLQHLDLGFVPRNVVSMYVGVPSNAWMQQLIARLEASSLVTAAGAVYLRPLQLGPIGQEAQVVLEGQVDSPDARRSNPTLNYQVATPGYFQAIGAPLRAGRLFTVDDTSASTRVVVVSEIAARRLWAGQEPIGRRLLLPSVGADTSDQAWRTVVGVVGNVTYRGLGDVRLDVYEPALQVPTTATYLVVRATTDPLSAAALVRTEIRQLDASVVVDAVATLDDTVSRATAPWRFASWMLTLLATFGFVLAAAGLFSIVALDVAGRDHELAVRATLGAPRGTLVAHILKPAGWRIACGLARVRWAPSPAREPSEACCLVWAFSTPRRGQSCSRSSCWWSAWHRTCPPDGPLGLTRWPCCDATEGQ